MNQLQLRDEFERILGGYQPSPAARQALGQINLTILSAPTASGRNTIINELVKTGRYHYLVSDTTRQPRVNNGLPEKNGQEYWFRSEREFLADLKAGEFLEAAIIHNQQVSGTSVRELQKAAKENKMAIGETEVVGAEHIHQIKPDTIFIFLLPPSFEIWMQRLAARGQMDINELRRRLSSAKIELETAVKKDYFNFVINDDLDKALSKVDSLAQGKQQTVIEKTAAIQLAQELLSQVRIELAR